MKNVDDSLNDSLPLSVYTSDDVSGEGGEQTEVKVSEQIIGWFKLPHIVNSNVLTMYVHHFLTIHQYSLK